MPEFAPGDLRDQETLKAAEAAIPPLAARPDPVADVAPGDPLYEAVGKLYRDASHVLWNAGHRWRVRRTRPAQVAPGMAVLYIPTAARAPGRDNKAVVGVWRCRALTPEEEQLVAAYERLPAVTLGRMFKRMRPQDRADAAADVGHPWLCYAAVLFDPDRGNRFGTFAGKILWSSFLKWARTRDLGDASLDYLRAETNIEPAARPDAPDHSDDVLRDLFRTYAPCADIRTRDMIVAYLGLDGGPHSTYKQVGKQFGVSYERVRQLVEHTFMSIRAHRRGPAGRREAG